MLTKPILLHDFQPDIDAVRQIAAVPNILEVICRITGMRFCAVARVTEDRWVACEVKDDIAFGLVPGGELKVETTLCYEIRQSGEPVVINEVSADKVYCGHPTPAMYGFQSYISMPIVMPSGVFFGTLCAIDPRPARVNTPEIVGMFKLFAELIAFHLQAHEQLAMSAADLRDERHSSQLREQFIAVLGHDLRNPLAAIDAGTKLLLKTPLDDKAVGIAGLIQKSVSRMSGLIDNVLDFARARLGQGLTLNRDNGVGLADALNHVIDEIRAYWPERPIETQIALTSPVHCDVARIAQLFSNLLASDIARAHDGKIDVSSTAEETRFTFRMPLL